MSIFSLSGGSCSSNWLFRKLEIKYNTLPLSMSELKPAVEGLSTDVSGLNSTQRSPVLPCKLFPAIPFCWTIVELKKNHCSSQLEHQILRTSVLKPLPLHGLSLSFFTSLHSSALDKHLGHLHATCSISFHAAGMMRTCSCCGLPY